VTDVVWLMGMDRDARSTSSFLAGWAVLRVLGLIPVLVGTVSVIATIFGQWPGGG
jgi:hypothetical protein